MRLLMISDRYPPEMRSVAQLFQDLAERLTKRGHDVTVLTKMPREYLPGDTREEHSGLPAIDRIAGVEIIRIPGLFSFKRSLLLKAVDQLYFALRVFWCAVHLQGPDAVLVYSPPLPLAVTGAIYGKWTHVPYLLNLHDLYPRTAIELGALKNKILIWGARWLEVIAYKSASYIIVPAPGSQRILIGEKGVQASRVHLVFNWVDTNSVRPALDGDSFRKANGLSGLFVVSYAGLMGYAQDMTTIIECARKMCEQRDIMFLLVGDGVYADKWRRVAQDFENVRFFPPVSKQAYTDLLQASDVCLVPLTATLLSPAIPGKMQNIMAVGKPVVAVVPSESDAAWMVNQSRCGLIVSPGDPRELQRVLTVLYDNPSLREELGRNGRRYAEEHFDLDAAVSEFEKVLGMAFKEQSLSR